MKPNLFIRSALIIAVGIAVIVSCKKKSSTTDGSSSASISYIGYAAPYQLAA